MARFARYCLSRPQQNCGVRPRRVTFRVGHVFRRLLLREVLAMSSDAPMAVAFFVSAASVAWSAAYAWTHWLVRPHQEPDLVTRTHQYQLEQRLADMERAIQTIGVEVERLAEGQRFTSRLLAERSPVSNNQSRLQGEVRRVDTPH